MKKKILFFTGTRAEYGLLSPLIQLFKKDEKYNIELLVSGMHLMDKFGSSYQEIEKEGHVINYKVDLNIKDDSHLAIAHSVGVGVQKFSDILEKARPDLCFVLGDRSEAVAFALSCQLLKVPLAHIHGGEVTEGAMDEAFRHSITKFSQLHFTTAEEHVQRVIQLGEEPARVFNVGALGVDNALSLKKMSRTELEQELNFKFQKTNYLVTFHPETLGDSSTEQQMNEVIKAFTQVLKDDVLFIFTMPNADAGNEIIFKKIYDFEAQYPHQVRTFKTLGKLRYLSLMSHCQAVIGNSSSGLIEAPALNVMTLNIGDRQKGRLRGASVTDVPCRSDDIVKGFARLQSVTSKISSPYGEGKAALKIKDILDKTLQQAISVRKKFYDRH